VWIFDILLPVGIGVFTFVLAYMGVHVTLHPPEENAKTAWKRGFWAVAFSGCVLIAWQGVRSVRAQDALQTQLDRIEHNKPIVNVPAPIVNIPPANPPKPSASLSFDEINSAYARDGLPPSQTWLVPNRDIQANIYYVNYGSAVADKVMVYGSIYLLPSDPNKADAMKIEEKKRDVQMLVPKFISTSNKALLAGMSAILPPGGQERNWFTAHSETPITQHDIDNLQSGAELLFLFFTVKYVDPAGSHSIRRCLISQTPAFNPEVWQSCSGFQDIR
jgi:hypothetical protein